MNEVCMRIQIGGIRAFDRMIEMTYSFQCSSWRRSHDSFPRKQSPRKYIGMAKLIGNCRFVIKSDFLYDVNEKSSVFDSLIHH